MHSMLMGTGLSSFCASTAIPRAGIVMPKHCVSTESYEARSLTEEDTEDKNVAEDVSAISEV